MAKKKKPLPKKRPIPAGEAMQDMPFPVQGVDVSSEFSLQPEETCPKGLNVRAWEPLTMRRRGGSRPGISKYVAQQVPAGAHLIQHLNYVVDPTEDALLTAFEPVGADGGVTDPSTNNLSVRNPGPRQVRRGGSGIAHNRHRYRKATLTSNIQFRQFRDATFYLSPPSVGQTYQFNMPPLAGSLLLAAVCADRADTWTVSDTNANLWSQIDGYVSLTTFGTPAYLSVWFTTNFGSANPRITVKPTAYANFTSLFLEYTGVKVGPLALDGNGPASNAAGSTNVSTNIVPVFGPKPELLVGFFGIVPPPPLEIFTPNNPFTLRGRNAYSEPTPPLPLLYACDILTQTSAAPVNGTMSAAGPYVSMGASFFPL